MSRLCPMSVGASGLSSEFGCMTRQRRRLWLGWMFCNVETSHVEKLRNTYLICPRPRLFHLCNETLVWVYVCGLEAANLICPSALSIFVFLRFTTFPLLHFRLSKFTRTKSFRLQVDRSNVSSSSSSQRCQLRVAKMTFNCQTMLSPAKFMFHRQTRLSTGKLAFSPANFHFHRQTKWP